MLINSIQFVQSTPSYVSLPINATWAQNGSIIAGQASGTAGTSTGFLDYPAGIFITSDDVLCIADWDNDRIVMVDLDSLAVIRTFGSGPGSGVSQFESPRDVFVLETSIYILDGSNDRIVKWSINGTNPSTVPGDGTFVSSYFMFIDRNNNTYLSVHGSHKVICFAPNSASPTTVAGIGTAGTASNQLNNPYGVFVDNNLTVYIADSYNDRIQKYTYGATSGLTVAGTGITGSSLSQLDWPSTVVVDLNGYIYVADTRNYRIVRWAPGASAGVCIVACTGNTGTSIYQLKYPYGLAFDSSGSLYVSDADNNRVHKFQILTKQTTTTTTTTTTTKTTSTTTTTSTTSISTTTTTATVTTTAAAGTIITITNTATAGTSTATITTTASPGMLTSKEASTLTLSQITTGIQTISTSTILSTNKYEQTSQVPNIMSTKVQSTTIYSSTTTTTTNQFNCSNAIISLSPNNPSITTPFEILRSEDFSISSTLEFNCLQSLGVIQQWSIKKCLNSSCLTKQEIKVSSIKMTLGELFIRSKTLEYGIYEMNLTVQMSISSSLISSALTYIKIISSPIQVKLIQSGSSIIIRGQQQTLTLDPERYSIDPDQIYFNSTNWNYKYYCQIYNNNTILNSNITMLLNSSISSCFINSTNGINFPWEYGSNISQSSLILNNGSLQSNKNYHFRVELINIKNASMIYTGDLLLQVENEISMTIIIKCIISNQCLSKNEYKIINPTTQISLTSSCIDNISSNMNIQWNIYYGIVINNFIQWKIFENTTQYINQGIFGINSNNFTMTKDILLIYSTIKYWKFEVIYILGAMKGVGLINFIINSPPSNGNCSINPLNGTIITLFNISCFNWFDEDGIKDYSFYIWTTNKTNRLMIGYTTLTNFQVRIPTNNFNSSLIHLLVRVRDKYDSITELNLSSIIIQFDSNNVFSLIKTIESAVLNSDYTSVINSNPLINILYGGNQNDVNQVLTSFSQILNLLAKQNHQLAIQNNISPLSISISSLNQDYSVSYNQSEILNNNLTEYKNQLNIFAAVKEYLIKFLNNLTITTAINSILFQGSTLSQLTSITNQLTRDSLIIASTRCKELSNILLDNAHLFSYEDVQLAATFLSQCASNVLTAVNGPIQERIIVLNLDLNRANNFPNDYDTDLEYDWSNLNLFSNGNDFSEETIKKNRNIYYQKQIAKIINKQFEETIKMITNSLNIHLNIEQISSINTSSIIMILKKLKNIDTMSNQSIYLNDKTQILIPENIYLNASKNSTILLRCIQTPLSISGNLADGNMNLSNLILITFVNENGEEIKVNTNEINPIEFFIPRDNNLIISSMILQNVTTLIPDSSINNRQFNLHFINITQINKNISLSVHFEMNSFNSNLGYMLIYKFDGIPQLNNSIKQIDDWTILCPQNNLNYFINNNKTIEHKSIIFGIRELNLIEFEIYCINKSKNILITDKIFNFSSNYEVRIFTSGCYYLDLNNNWQSNGLIVGSLTTYNRTQCFSTHLTSFATGFLILPKSINWNYVFSNTNFLKNKTLYLTVIIIVIIFISIGIYARHLDNKDNQKLGITILSDNQLNDKYFYQILVFTGIWKNASTNAKVHFILSGNNYETNIRTLTNSNQKLFQRGSIDSFIFSVPKSLGLLNYLRIWHDNSGDNSLSSSWFLKYVIIRDLQTMEKFYFICQQWLSKDKYDKKIERIIQVSNKEQIREFVYPLPEKAYYKLSDGHLWFSIFSQPPSIKFSRIQRCICCFVLLFIVMLLDILYYDQSNEMNSEIRVGGLLLGPFYFSSQQINIGLFVDILMFIPSTLLVIFFRRIRQYRSSQQNSSINGALSKLRSNQVFQPTTIITMRIMINEERKRKKEILFPWWCVFIAYGISFILIGLSIFLIIARGIEFGEIKVQKWLASLIIAFLSSVLLSQPIKVLLIAIFVAFMSRRSINDDDELVKYLDENEEFYLNGGAEHFQSISGNVSTIDRRLMRMNRLSRAEIFERRKIRLKEMKMWSYIRHLLFYSCYLCLLYVVTYANRNPHSYQQVHHLRHFFLNSHNSTYNYTKISTIDEYWKWLENSFVSNIRAQSWYNGDPPRDLSGFMNDKTSRLIGWPVMRQLRIKSNFTCRIPILIRRLIPKCKGDYSSLNEDHQKWFPGWKSINDNISYSQSIKNAFIYQSGVELDSYKYKGIFDIYDNGGYVYEFRGRLNEMKDNLTKLRELSWIDSQTRAILIQMTIYNSNVELFTSITFLIELFSTGGIFPQSRFQPIDLHDQFEEFSSILYSIFSIIYMLFIIYFTFIEICLLIKLKKKYFNSIWCFIQWGTIICSWTGLGIYIWRFSESSYLRKLFVKTNGYKYINIEMNVYIDDLLMFLFGFCCFFSTIKYLYLFRFNSRLSQFGKTLEYVKKDLLYFASTFSIVFISFLSLFYLLFFSKILSCSDVYHTAEMLFEMLLLKFDSQDLYEAEIFLGPFVFTLFIYFVVFICCTMIISIINDGFRHIRLKNQITLNDDQNQDVLLFLYIKMKHAIGMKQNHQINCQENKSALDQLSDKIDQLAITLNKLNINSSKPPRVLTVPSVRNADIYVEDV